MKIIDAWESFTDSDLNEGRGSEVHLAYSSTLETAKKLSQGEGVMGTDAYTREVEVLLLDNGRCRGLMEDEEELYGSMEDKETKDAKNKLANFVSKLSKNERKILGL